jgi:TrkA domain protein
MEIRETPLPGLGVRYDVATREGQQLGLVVRRDGTAELVLYGEADPDAVIDRIVLDSEERAVLGELLVLPPGQDETTTRNTHHRTWELTEDQP